MKIIDSELHVSHAKQITIFKGEYMHVKTIVIRYSLVFTLNLKHGNYLFQGLVLGF